jgi:hypothetical protein
VDSDHWQFGIAMERKRGCDPKGGVADGMHPELENPRFRPQLWSFSTDGQEV